MNDLEVSCAKYRKQIETLQKQAKEAAQVNSKLCSALIPPRRQ